MDIDCNVFNVRMIGVFNVRMIGVYLVGIHYDTTSPDSYLLDKSKVGEAVDAQ